MSKRCPACGSANDDSRIYCSACGELLSSELRLIKNLEESSSTPVSSPSSNVPDEDEKPAARRRNGAEEDDYVAPRRHEEKKSGATPWILLGLLAVAAVLIFCYVL